jgi:hypothetical protein
MAFASGEKLGERNKISLFSPAASRVRRETPYRFGAFAPWAPKPEEKYVASAKKPHCTPPTGVLLLVVVRSERA